MILEEETYIKFGYYPRDLKPKSGKRIIASCDKCGKVREIFKYAYHKLCKSCVKKGSCHSNKTKQKMSKTRLHMSDETKQKMSQSRIGKKNPMFGIKRMGKNNPNWKGGVSFEPYCILFTEEFKERIREYWDRKCVLCGKSEKENDRKLAIHHIDYDKMTCCDDSIPLFVPLCMLCHGKTSGNRKYWKNYFYNMIYSQNKNGKCFYSQEEMHLFKKKK